MSQTTLMNVLDELALDVASDPEPHMSGEALFGLLRTDQEDLDEFILANMQAATAMAKMLGSTRVAMEGLVQTVLTVGYNLRVHHEQEDNVPVPNDE